MPISAHHVRSVGANIGLFSLYCNRILASEQPPDNAAFPAELPRLHSPQTDAHDATPRSAGDNGAGASAAGAGDRIFAFEPVGPIFAVLKRNLARIPAAQPRHYGLAAFSSASEPFAYYPDRPAAPVPRPSARPRPAKPYTRCLRKPRP